ncbi:MAG: hypothetical protein J6N76_06815 [Lachnospiraceae bacterium]|nr:hypothetical protein [Lachnospiraceae bacterium]
MNRSRSKKYNIDTRTASDIEKSISELAGLYDTAWHFDDEKPDIGTTISKIFAMEMEENVLRVNDIMDRYHTEFVNMLDISLLPAKPSSGYVIMDVVADTIEGVGVKKGSKLVAGVGDNELIFETEHSIYVTGAYIAAAFMTDGEEKTFVPLLGDYALPRIFGEGGIVELTPEEAAAEDEPGSYVLDSDASDNYEHYTENELKPFTLFGRGKGIGKDAVLFFHRFLFNVDKDEVYVRFTNAETLIKGVADGKFTFKYVSKRGLLPVDEVEVLPDNETIMLRKSEKSKPVPLSGDESCMIAMISEGRVGASYKADEIRFSARGDMIPPESVTDDNIDLDIDKFAPFSNTLSEYSECYIGHDIYFAKKGARIDMSFDLVFEENRIALNPPEHDLSLKIIKRRPKNNEVEVYADAYADEIIMEYFNGIGWKRLPMSAEVSGIFAKPEARHIDLSFVVPDDWESISAGAYEGRSIRMQLVKSDNCYLRPAIHHYPVINNLKLSYTFDDTYMPAERIEMISGTKKMDITRKQNEKGGVTIFSISEYTQDALYLGLSDRITNGPVSLYFALDEEVRYNGLPTIVEYSGPDGVFRQMKVLDYTGELSKTGSIAFVPPSDWVAAEIEDKRLYWIRIVRAKKESLLEDASILPHIKDIRMNAVQVRNIQTLDETDAYIEEVVPNTRFTIGATGILDASVWVNEMGRYSQEKMREMKNENPDDIRIEEDQIGTIVSFYVLWHETDRFETAGDKRVYMLDRLTNELIFGNGIDTWIPSVTNDVAIRFSVRCCNGATGNVEAGAINDSMDNLRFIGDITNPAKSYGGSNIESIESALERGASILSSRRRLVTMDDYLRAIMAYSDTIDQAAGIVGETVEGEIDDSSLTFLLLMKEFSEGSFAFHRVVNELKSHLLEQCELTVVADKLHIIEPIFVDISVDAWVTVVQLDESFEIQNMLTECLDEYLNPLGYENGVGWKIGTIPKKPQILMRLGILKSRAIVRKSAMIASYTDHEGYHEVDLEDLKVTPFMVCRSGKHEVHIIY